MRPKPGTESGPLTTVPPDATGRTVERTWEFEAAAIEAPMESETNSGLIPGAFPLLALVSLGIAALAWGRRRR